MHDEDLMPIGRFARAARVTVRTLRHYHTLGVLVPARVDPGSGYRYYHRTQLADMASVRLLRELDVPLDTIRAYRDGSRSLSSILEEERARLAAEASRAARGVAMIDQLARTAELPAYDAEVVRLEPSAALAIVGAARAETLLTDATRLISRLLAGAEDLGVDTSSPVIGEYPGSLEGTVTVRLFLPLESPAPVEVESVGSDAGDMSSVPTGGAVGDGPEALAGVGAIHRSSLPEGRYGRVVHTGPLESLPLAYHQLLGWLHRTGHPVRGPFLERYVDDPATTDPVNLRTEVLHPVPVDR